VSQVKQFRVRIARRAGLASEVTSALWQKGVHIEAFSAEFQAGEHIFHLAVDKATLAKETFAENGWQAIEEGVSPETYGRKAEVHI
jgi:hypothetical protein